MNPSKLCLARPSYLGPIYDGDDENSKSDTSADEIDIGMVKVTLEEKTST